MYYLGFWPLVVVVKPVPDGGHLVEKGWTFAFSVPETGWTSLDHDVNRMVLKRSIY